MINIQELKQPKNVVLHKKLKYQIFIIYIISDYTAAMKIPKRSTQANESSTSGSEGEVPPVQRTYAEVTTGLTTSGSDSVPPPGPLQPPHEVRQAPPGPPGPPPRAEGRSSPPPVASGSGTQTAKSAKKRKRETGPEEISESEAKKANSLLRMEMALVASRAKTV